ncbi:hypothetical protein LJC05_04075 [Bacteroides sp. OttesenSCG-928-J23]|nr:hypothetical protein [Bacteroides sp. OttesenSCG-928-J23]
MNKKTTTSTTKTFEEKREKRTTLRQPSSKTLKFIELFAHNYYAEMRMPAGLQDVIVG